MLPNGDRRGKLCYRRLRHTDGGQKRAGPLRCPSGHCGPCTGIASLFQSFLTCEQDRRPMAGPLSSYVKKGVFLQQLAVWRKDVCVPHIMFYTSF